MKTFYIILFFSSVLFSCNRKQEQTHIVNNKNDSVLSDSSKMIKDTISNPQKVKKDYGTVSGTSFYDFPKDEKQLKAWKRKVLVEGKPYYYWQLSNYSVYYPEFKNEMIELTQAMIDRNRSMNEYKAYYYYYVKKANYMTKVNT